MFYGFMISVFALFFCTFCKHVCLSCRTNKLTYLLTYLLTYCRRCWLVCRRCWISKSSTDEATDPHPVSPKSLVSEVDDEMYLRPSNGCHGDGASVSNSGCSPPGHSAPDPPRPQPSGRQGDGHLGDGRQDNESPPEAASRCSECCCCCNADACPPKDAAIAGPSTLGPPSRTGRLRQAAASTATGGGSTGPAYRRAASCIEQNKYTHIWQMPLPIPGE